MNEPNADPQAVSVDIGIFAHNEGASIAATLESLGLQTLLQRSDVSLRIYVLANGCTDDTAAQAAAVIATLPAANCFEVVDLAQGGKSRTWNVFVHEISRPSADYLIFCDADITIPDPEMLSRFVDTFGARQDLVALNSRPVKDLVYSAEKLSLVEKLIASSGGALDDWRKAICGQLYALRTPVARKIHLPIGLPVEDGFVRAMLMTDLLSVDENTDLVDGVDGLYHVYASERTLPSLLRHQTRLVIGSAINAAVFEHLRALQGQSVGAELVSAAQDENWLTTVSGERLPKRGYGWVPVHYLVRRTATSLRGGKVMRPKALVLLVAGFGFDLIVYVSAQAKMARGVGAGYW